MTLIALEEHILPIDLATAVRAGRRELPGIGDALADVGDARLRTMDAAGIDIQVLSVTAPGAQEASAREAVPLARLLNDRTAAAVEAHPTRFRALASLPTPDPVAAADEARRAVEELGFLGVIVNGHTNGEFLDAPRFEPILSAVEALGVPMYLHPTFPTAAVLDAYYGGLDAVTARVLSTGAWGWHAETGLHVLRMAVGGVFERHPGLQVLVGHMGENLPFSLMRADSRLAIARPDLPSVADTIRDHVHITICGYTTVPPLQCALAVFGADRVLFSVDYPYSDCVQTAAFLADAPVSPADREKIAHRNAERLFGI